MTRHMGLVALVVTAVACKPPKPGDPLGGLSAAERARFDSGRAIFDSTFTAATGLGPLFNASGCGECHEEPVTGGVGDEVERHAAVFHPERIGFVCDQLADKGGPVFQDSVTPALRAALGIDSEPLPAGVTTVAARTTPDILGFGLLDAVPDSVILSYADPDDTNRDGISGRPNRFLDGRLGRFGRKAFVPTLREFNAGAFPTEVGITDPAAPDENTVTGSPLPAGTDPVPEPELNARGLELTDAFVQLLAPPAPLKQSKEAQHGRDVFTRIGCPSCHIPTLRTGDNPIAALSHKDVAAYSDLLLHDMGQELADICFGLATPSEFRTEPLMGLRFSTQFLHDGRATTPEQAIDFHGGEASRSRDLFRALPAGDRAAVVAFLKTL
ncbi:MAG TPA: di-heme oxidoredictase family protein [Gemmatimonadales bacterium]|nr:di-heme oxidoredictase family protein [Gemmatimonadales bacterium]